MDCREVKRILKEEAPTREKCLTKWEIRNKADRLQSGISGSRTNECLERLKLEGVAKEDKKCFRWTECYYDPPVDADEDWVLLLLAVFAMNGFLAYMSARIKKISEPLLRLSS